MQLKWVGLIWAALILGGCADAVDWMRWVGVDKVAVKPAQKPLGKAPGPKASNPVEQPDRTALTCPGASQAAYDALQKPEPLTPVGVTHTPSLMGRWMADAQEQIRELKEQLRGSLKTLEKCRATS